MPLARNLFDLTASLTNRRGLLLASAGAIATGAILGGVSGYRSDPQADLDERMERAANGSLGYAVLAGAAVPGLAMLSVAAPTLGTLAGKAVSGGFRRVSSYLREAYWSSLQEKSFSKAFFGRAPIAAGAGGVLGAVIGSQVAEDSGKGAFIGGAAGMGIGLAVRSGMRGSRAWKLLSKVPGGKSAALVLGAAAVGFGARALTSQPDYESSASAVSDEMGGYTYQSGTRDRLDRLSATGDMVFGLHNLRH